MQDVVRRMTNCDRRTELEEVGDFLSRFSFIVILMEVTIFPLQT